jgi:hypothetical protein
MRKWFWNPDDPDNLNNAPDQFGISRLSTNLPGDEGIYHFDDQSDRFLQRLYLNRRTEAGGGEDIDIPHPLMQFKGFDGSIRAIVHIPDHPHEGECIIPEDLETTFLLDGEKKREWPLEIGGGGAV